MELGEFEAALLAVLEKHRPEDSDVGDFISVTLAALLFIPANRMLLIQLIDKSLEKVDTEAKRMFLDDFRNLLMKLGEGQGH